MSAKLNLHVVDMEANVLETAKQVSWSVFTCQVIIGAFDDLREEKKIAEAIKHKFDKDFGK